MTGIGSTRQRWVACALVAVVILAVGVVYLLNAIANHIIKTGRVNRDFVGRHTVFKRGQTDIGYGLRPEHPLQKSAKVPGRRPFKGESPLSTAKLASTARV